MSIGTKYLIVAGLLLYWFFLVAFGGSPTVPGYFAAGIGIAIAGSHAVSGYGWRDTSVYLLMCLLVTFTVENIGVATGFPFGSYHFEALPSLPYVGYIPLVVGFLYFGVGYVAWVVAGILLDDPRRVPDTLARAVTLPLVAAFVMVQWDLVMDPAFSTIGKAWIWEDGGHYFGVPLSNFVGWFLTVWLYFQAFAFYLYRRRQNDDKSRLRTGNRYFWLVPIMLYLGIGLSNIVPAIFGVSDGYVTDPSGKPWSVQALRETTALVAVFTMCFTSVLAWLRWQTLHHKSERGYDSGEPCRQTTNRSR